MQNTNINSPKRSLRLNNKRLARLDIKKDANTDTPSVHADFTVLTQSMNSEFSAENCFKVNNRYNNLLRKAYFNKPP